MSNRTVLIRAREVTAAAGAAHYTGQMPEVAAQQILEDSSNTSAMVFAPSQMTQSKMCSKKSRQSSIGTHIIAICAIVD